MSKTLLVLILLSVLIITVSCGKKDVFEKNISITVDDTNIPYVTSETHETVSLKEMELLYLGGREIVDEKSENISEYPEFEEIYIHLSSDTMEMWNKIENGLYPNDFVISFSNIPKLKLKIKGFGEDSVYNKKIDDYTVTDIFYNYSHFQCTPPLVFNEGWFSLLSSKDIIIIGNISPTGSYQEDENEPNWYFLTPFGNWHTINIPGQDGYECKFYEEQENIVFIKRNCDYLTAIHSLHDMAKIYTGDNQFFYESGILDIQDGKIHFKSTKFFTLNDWYLSDEFIDKGLRDKYQVSSIGEFYEFLSKNKE